jgi:hypothetical protein
MDLTGKKTESSEPDGPHVVTAVFYEDERVENAVHKLREIGFAGEDIEVAEESLSQPETEQLPKDNCFLNGATTGLTSGAIVGGVFGLLMGIGALPRFSIVVLRDIAAGVLAGIVAGALLGGAIGCLAAWRMAAKPNPAKHPEPAKSGVLVTVEAGPRDEEAKSALIESGGDLGPTNAAEIHLL